MGDSNLSTAERDLERALERAEDGEVRYHIRQAAQRIVAAEWQEKD